MRALASLLCGFIFGWGLFISGMMQPAKVLGFLDLLAIPSGGWDPSLIIVMAVALGVTGTGYVLLRPRKPVLEVQNQWPEQVAIDRQLVGGSVLFGIGWGLVGLCPGPAIENLATLNPGIIVFVIAMAVGMVAQNFWQRQATSAGNAFAHAGAVDG